MSPTPSQALIQAGIKEADSVLVAGLRFLDPADADAFVMASVLQVQEASCICGRAKAPHIVSRARKSTTAPAINQFLASLSRVNGPYI